MTGRLLTPEQVAETLGVSVRYVWRLARDGQFDRVRVGRKYVRFEPQAVQAFIERGRERPVEAPTPLRQVEHGRRRFRQEAA